MLIQEMLQVELLFQLEVIAEGQMTQLSIKLVTLYEKKNKTDFCENCSTRELSDRVRQLTLDLLSQVDTSDLDVVDTRQAERQKRDSVVEGMNDNSLSEESKKKTLKKEDSKVIR